MSLLSSKREIVVSESVVVLKQLLQMPRREGISYDGVIKQLARLFSKVTSPRAKASIIWVVGEYVDVIKYVHFESILFYLLFLFLIYSGNMLLTSWGN